MRRTFLTSIITTKITVRIITKEEEGEDSELGWSQIHESYYYRTYGRSATRNFIASDLGLTLKKGSNGNYFVVANDSDHATT